MQKIWTVIKLLLNISSRLLGAIFAIAAIDFIKQKDNSTALFCLAFAVVFMFLPDLIRNRLNNM